MRKDLGRGLGKGAQGVARCERENRKDLERRNAQA
jgi:hypothetical protein